MLESRFCNGFFSKQLDESADSSPSSGLQMSILTISITGALSSKELMATFSYQARVWKELINIVVSTSTSLVMSQASAWIGGWLTEGDQLWAFITSYWANVKALYGLSKFWAISLFPQRHRPCLPPGPRQRSPYRGSHTFLSSPHQRCPLLVTWKDFKVFKKWCPHLFKL